MKLKIWNKIREYLPYIAVILAVVLPWFFHSGYLFFTDMVWGPNFHLNIYSGWIFIDIIIKILSVIIPLYIAQKIFIASILLVILIGSKKILSFFIKEQYMVFVLSLFFLFNPFIYDRLLYGQIGIVLSFGFMLYAFGLLFEFTKEKKNKQLICAGILMGLSIAICLQALLFNFLLFILFLIFLVFQNKDHPIRNIFKSILVIGILILFFNLNWIVASFFNKLDLVGFIEQGVSKQDLIAFQTTGKTPLETINNIVMMSGFWGKDQNRYVDLTKIKENWGRSFYILLPLVFWGMYLGLRDKKYRALSIGLVVLFLISVFLAVGIKVAGARESSIWLFDHFYPYRGFREPQKWVALVVLVYGIFLALGAKELFSKQVVKNNKVVVAIVLAVIIIFQAPLLLWGFGGQIRSVNYPTDWSEVNSLIVKDSNCQKNILFLPWHMYMSFGFIGNIVANPASNFFTCSVISGTNMEWGGIYDNSGKKEGILVDEWIRTKGETSFLQKNELNIGYIIIAKELDWLTYNWIENDKKQLELIKETEHLKLYKVIYE